MAKISSSAAFEAVTAYAIDDPTIDHDRSSLLAKIGLNKESFFDPSSGLFVERGIINYIKEKLLYGSRILLIWGFPGTGKTTLIHRAISDVQHSRNVFFLHFDFRAKDSYLDTKNCDEITSEIQSQLLARAKTYCTQIDISDYDLIRFFIGLKSEEYWMPIEYQTAHRELFNEYKIKNHDGQEFDDWLLAKARNPTAKIEMHLGTMIRSLTVRDYLYYICNNGKDENDSENTLVIVLFDNIDSIHSNSKREELIKYIRTLHGRIGDCAKIVFASRNASLAKSSWPDYGAHVADDIQVDYSEFIDEDAVEFQVARQAERTGECGDFDRLDIRRNLEHNSRDSFSSELLSRRIEFVDQKCKESSINTDLDSDEYNEVKALYASIRRNGNRISYPLFELSNYDRRMMFLHLCNLVRFVHEKMKMRYEQLGSTDSERDFVLESIFYSRLNDEESMFQFDALNIFGELQSCQDDSCPLGCSLTHLLLCVIYKLTNRRRGVHSYGENTTVKRVLDRLGEIGYDKEDVRRRIFEIYKTGNNYHGLIETARFIRVNTCDDIDDGDPIWLTPRAAYLCDFLSHKFLYLLSCLRKNRFAINGEIFSYRDHNAITASTIYNSLRFLITVGDIHIRALQLIRERLGRDDWYSYYRRWFCISQRTGSGANHLGLAYLGNLQLENILHSHERFLEKQARLEGFEWIKERQIAEVYQTVRSHFSNEVKKIVGGENIRAEWSFSAVVHCEEIEKQLISSD